MLTDLLALAEGELASSLDAEIRETFGMCSQADELKHGRTTSELTWRPIKTAPRDGTWIVLAGPSGMTATPLRAEVARYYPAFRPLTPWQTHANESFTDGGPEPTHWLPLPQLPPQ